MGSALIASAANACAGDSAGDTALALVAVLPFGAGGYRDKRACVLCCLHRTCLGTPQASQSGFDWILRDAAKHRPACTWKDLKPTLEWYQPERSRLGHESRNGRIGCGDVPSPPPIVSKRTPSVEGCFSFVRRFGMCS